jgi:hypothetical protein
VYILKASASVGASWFGVCVLASSAVVCAVEGVQGSAAGETYEPHFTYHGFQYVEVLYYPGDLSPADIVQVRCRVSVDQCVVLMALVGLLVCW